MKTRSFISIMIWLILAGINGFYGNWAALGACSWICVLTYRLDECERLLDRYLSIGEEFQKILDAIENSIKQKGK